MSNVVDVGRIAERIGMPLREAIASSVIVNVIRNVIEVKGDDE